MIKMSLESGLKSVETHKKLRSKCIIEHGIHVEFLEHAMVCSSSACMSVQKVQTDVLQPVRAQAYGTKYVFILCTCYTLFYHLKVLDMPYFAR